MIIHPHPLGFRYGVRGEKPRSPAPTLFVLATRIEETLENEDYNKAGRLLAAHGWLSATLDIPGHGENVREGEPTSLPAWRYRLERGEDFIAPFAARVSSLLDHLIAERYTDPEQVAVLGTSRGGFLALHWAATEGRVRAIVAVAPVADLRVLPEFNGMENHELTQAVALDNVAGKLAGRAIWMCIGNHDERVSTDNCIRFSRRIVAASIAQRLPANVELHVTTAVGHGTHPTAHDEAAVWLRKQLPA
jgi:dienelactone hydrolase